MRVPHSSLHYFVCILKASTENPIFALRLWYSFCANAHDPQKWQHLGGMSFFTLLQGFRWKDSSGLFLGDCLARTSWTLHRLPGNHITIAPHQEKAWHTTATIYTLSVFLQIEQTAPTQLVTVLYLLILLSLLSLEKARHATSVFFMPCQDSIGISISTGNTADVQDLVLLI